MSVPVGKRGLSDLEFYKNAIRLRSDITDLLLRDFGIKDKVRDTGILSKANVSEEDRAQLDALIKKYGISKSILDEYPEWYVNHLRSHIIEEMTQMILNIREANTIYPTSEAEFFERRIDIDRAIGCCEKLLELMQYAIETMPVNAQKYMRFVKEIDTEKKLLKGWRKSDNKLLRKLKEDASPPNKK